MFWIFPAVFCSIEDNMLDITNRYRIKHNMSILEKNESLREVAQEQADYMCEKRTLTHDSPDGELRDRLNAKGFKGVKIGENIAKQQGSNYREVLRLWMENESHRRNVIGDFDYVGIGTCTDEDKNRYYVEVFGKNIQPKEQENYIILIKPTDKGIIMESVNDKSMKPLSYNILNEDSNGCIALKECKVGELVTRSSTMTNNLYTDRSTSNLYTEMLTDRSTSTRSRKDGCYNNSCSSKGTASSTPQIYFSTASINHSMATNTKTVTKTNLIYKTITETRNGTSSPSRSTQSQETPKESETSTVSATERFRTSSVPAETISDIPKYLNELKIEIINEIKGSISPDWMKISTTTRIANPYKNNGTLNVEVAQKNKQDENCNEKGDSEPLKEVKKVGAERPSDAEYNTDNTATGSSINKEQIFKLIERLLNGKGAQRSFTDIGTSLEM